MKKSWRNFWIACGIAGGIGVILIVVGMAMGATTDMFYNRFPYGVSFGYGNTGKHLEYDGTDTEEIFEQVEAIELDVSCLSVQVLKAEGSDEKVRMEAVNIDPRLRFQYEMEGSTLRLETDNINRVWGIRNIVNRGTLYLYVPQKQFEEVFMELGAGDIYIENIDTKDLIVNAGAGEVVIDNFTADVIDFECGVGDMQVVGKPKEDAFIECGVGNIDFTVDGSEQDYDYYVECGIGEVSIGGYSFSGLDSERQVDNGANQSMDIQCGIGGVSLSFTK